MAQQERQTEKQGDSATLKVPKAARRYRSGSKESKAETTEETAIDLKDVENPANLRPAVAQKLLSKSEKAELAARLDRFKEPSKDNARSNAKQTAVLQANQEPQRRQGIIPHTQTSNEVAPPQNSGAAPSTKMQSILKEEYRRTTVQPPPQTQSYQLFWKPLEQFTKTSGSTFSFLSGRSSAATSRTNNHSENSKSQDVYKSIRETFTQPHAVFTAMLQSFPKTVDLIVPQVKSRASSLTGTAGIKLPAVLAKPFSRLQGNEQSLTVPGLKTLAEAVKTLPAKARTTAKAMVAGAQKLVAAVKGPETTKPQLSQALPQRQKEAVRETFLSRTTQVKDYKKSDQSKVERPALAPSKIEQLVQTLQNDLRSSLRSAALTKIAVTDVRLNSLIDSSKELRHFATQLTKKAAPVKAFTSIEQVQVTLKEAFRMSLLKVEQSKAEPLTLSELKRLIDDTVRKVSVLYNVPPPASFRDEKQDPREQSRAKQTDGAWKPAFPQTPQQPPPAPRTQTDPPKGFAKTFREIFSKEKTEEKEYRSEEKEFDEEVKEVKTPELEDQAAKTDMFRWMRPERKLTVQSVYLITGRITERNTGKGVAGVVVDGGSLGTSVTDYSGEFRFSNVPEGKVYTLHFEKRGYRFFPSSLTDTADGPNRHDVKAEKK